MEGFFPNNSVNDRNSPIHFDFSKIEIKEPDYIYGEPSTQWGVEAA